MPDNNGDLLFRYKSMDTTDAVEHTLDILKKQRLYCPRIVSFNDPFECRANISFEALPKVKNARAKERLKKENPGMTDADAEKLAPKRWKQVEKVGWKEALHWLQHDIGVISFSEINDDILMWSHYGGGHNGICIEFRYTVRDHADFFAKAQRVEYQQQLPKVNFYTASSTKIGLAEKAFCPFSLCDQPAVSAQRYQ
ncbi:MAG TPA: hypothetical protein HPP87_08315 [Planctomycetes bacterium]|nr:hypothetical protein [Planctomycetota bacterium]